MTKTLLLFLVTILTIGIISGLLVFTSRLPADGIENKSSPQSNNISPTSPDEFATKVLAEGLDTPWALAFLPDNSLLVTERQGRLRLIDTNGSLLSEPISTLKNVVESGEGGLLGVTVHPDFTSNKYIYLYYTYQVNGENTKNRVARYKLENNKLSDEKIITDQIPGALFHNGGRIKFGPDKFLYITTGDAQTPSLAQSRTSLAGKVLRVTDDGDPAPGNPFGTRVYSYGHRNPQGITWNENGELYETEHGNSTTDELNIIDSGKNYGWPEVTGDEKRTGMITPLINSGSSTWAPGGAASYNGSIYFTGLRGNALYKVQTTSPSDLKELFDGDFGRIRDVVLGPDKMLYITTSNKDGRGTPKSGDDKIIIINPNKL